MTGQAIKKLRQRLGLTQSELAERLGVDQATIHRWEKGAKPSGPAEKLLQQIAARAA